ncbi:MAG: hypothetical protein IJ740_01795 [Ruminococcus sp.]|nr:hypothetical protein [Ruminococcus sp.]
MKKYNIKGVEWPSDSLKNWICREYQVYYGAKLSKTAVSISFVYLTKDDFAAIKFYVRTPKNLDYGANLRIGYTCVFETGVFIRDDY